MIGRPCRRWRPTAWCTGSGMAGFREASTSWWKTASAPASTSRCPADGLLIWHVDDNVSSDNTQEWYPGHTTSGHYLVAVEQADGLFQLEQNQNNGNSGDPFPGSANARSFNSTTTPSSLALLRRGVVRQREQHLRTPTAS